MKTKDLNNSISLSDLIKEVQRELEKAQNERIQDGRKRFFLVKEFEVEAKCIVVESKTTKGKFDLKVIGADLEGKIDTQFINSVRIKYEGPEEPKDFKTCPRCKNQSLNYQDGCLTCPECGYSQCG